MNPEDYFHPPDFKTPNPEADRLNAYRQVKEALGLRSLKLEDMPVSYETYPHKLGQTGLFCNIFIIEV